jgi:hypothetical protein
MYIVFQFDISSIRLAPIPGKKAEEMRSKLPSSAKVSMPKIKDMMMQRLMKGADKGVCHHRRLSLFALIISHHRFYIDFQLNKDNKVGKVCHRLSLFFF